MKSSLENSSRFDLHTLLDGKTDCIGAELGVAAGEYSAAMVASGKFKKFFGIDMYADTHDTAQYKEALATVGIFENYSLLRMTFDEALPLFPDNSLDFLYIDGYAATGMEGGKTIHDWARKVKVGGILAGDDYHTDFPLLQKVLDAICEKNNLELLLTKGNFDNSRYSNYPSWAIVKTAELDTSIDADLIEEGERATQKLRLKKQRSKKFDDLVKAFVPREKYDKLRAWNRRRKENRKANKG